MCKPDFIVHAQVVTQMITYELGNTATPENPGSVCGGRSSTTIAYGLPVYIRTNIVGCRAGMSMRLELHQPEVN
jgi:hypothetical protein